MSLLHFSRRLTQGTYHTVRIFVGILSVLALLLVLAFVFLRVYGVPGPILREIVRRANVAGIPIEVEGITLTLHGWRADQVRYYSDNPDDLVPLFQSRQVFFSARNNKLAEAKATGWNVDVRAVGVDVNPSVEWGVAIPQNSPVHHVEQMQATLGFRPDRIVISQGKVDWLGSQFHMNGAILKGTKVESASSGTRKQRTLSPVFITEQQFETFENRLKTFSLPGGATIDIDFSIDTTDYSASRIHLAVNAEMLSLRDVNFSRIEIEASYAYPTIELERAGLYQDRQSVQLSGKYNLDSKVVEGSLANTITSNRLLLLLPDWIHDLLGKAELRIDQLPRLDINVGPAPVTGLLNQLSGTFSIHGVGYQGIEIEVLRGQVKRENDRLEFSNLQVSALGQEERAEETGSMMRGGSAEGSVFWDGKTREFGVDVDASIDPNVLVQALSRIEIATNIIQRFKFNDQAPRGHVSVGADLDDLNTFYIDIQALGNEVIIEGVEFTSVNITQTYLNGKLSLDPMVTTQGSNFLKGSALLDFQESTASFDVLSNMDPADLEDLIYAPSKLFRNHINASGEIRIAARGTFDWGSMQQTDFTATVEAEHLKLPMAQLDHFTASVIGDGSLITVANAEFGLYGGEGEGEFLMEWNPALDLLPYESNLSFSEVDFRKCLVFFRDEQSVKVSGKMDGNAYIEADFSTNFFAIANGAGFIQVRDGQLADLPLFRGFSRLIRRIFPSFKIFTITRLKGNFALKNGVVSSEDILFEGNVIRAKGQGSYTQSSGFDANIQAQTVGDGMIFSAVRIFTDPLLKLFEMKLTGTLAKPVWELEKF